MLVLALADTSLLNLTFVLSPEISSRESCWSAIRRGKRLLLDVKGGYLQSWK